MSGELSMIVIRLRHYCEYPDIGGGLPLSQRLPFAAIVVAVIALFLGLDRFASAGEQFLLGAATWCVLIAACRPLPAEERARVALVVLVATCTEVLGSLILGVYEYRLSNLPAFVPPGHGLVYLGGLAIARWVLATGHLRVFVGAVLAVLLGWGVAGLAFLGRTDLAGAVAGAALAYCLLRGRSPALYGGVFLLVGFLELYGTAVGAWSWAEAVPGIGLPAGNPPSGIASIYVLFEIAAIALAPRLLTAIESVRLAGHRLARADRAQDLLGDRLAGEADLLA
jgi:hypothetical protein